MTKGFIKFTVALGVIVSIILIIFTLQFYRFLYSPLQIQKEGYVLFILPGTSAQKIATQLVEANILESERKFLFYIRMKGAWNKLKAGEYLIEEGSTPRDLLYQLSKGKVIQHALTIVPGWNFERLLMEVNQSPALVHTLTGLSFADIMAKLGHPGEHPEGKFLPETYYFVAGTTDVVFLQRAYNLLQEKLTILWNKPRAENYPLKSSYEALILASIIEKESSVFEEYAEIAGVYIRRLMRNMPLQADPTVIYGAGKAYKGNLTSRLLNHHTPYNTYRVVGLPPTPIALPSEKALEAALAPRPGNTLYFVAHKDGKGHVFSRTLEEHLIAVREYRKSFLKSK